MLFWVGAGLSQASGVPTPPFYAVQQFLSQPHLCWGEFLRWRQQVLVCQPNKGHELLYQLQQRQSVRIVTLNQDGLLQRAGCAVLELHGNGLRDRTMGAINRPDVICLGEELDQEAVSQAIEWLENSDVVVLVGTSSSSQPVCELPLRRRGRLLEINPEVTPLSQYCDECWRGLAQDLLERFL